MSRLFFAIFLLLFLFLQARHVSAASRAFFLMENFRHWADFTYDYDGKSVSGSGGRDSSSRQHRFGEGYHFAIDYELVGPRVLRGELGAEVRPQQTWFSEEGSSESGSSLKLLYDVRGTFLPGSDSPLSFYIQSETSHVDGEFRRSYDLETDSRGLDLFINSRYLPAHLYYRHSENQTDGLQVDRSSTNETYGLNLTNAYREISFTELDVSGIHDRTVSSEAGNGESKTDKAELSARNTLSWLEGKKRRNAVTSLGIVEQSGFVDFKTLALNESIIWDLGGALVAGADYDYNERDLSTGSRRSNSGHLYLKHQLVEALSTGLDLGARRVDLDSGREEEVSGGLDVAYVKKIPAEGRFRLQYTRRIGLTDRDFQERELVVLDEPHVVDLFQRLFLLNPNVVPESIVVRSGDPAQINTFFVRGIDYEVVTVGTQTEIEIPLGSQIDLGDELLISYSFQVNPDLKFVLHSQRVAGSLWLKRNKYRLHASWDESDPDVLSGEEAKVFVTSRQALRVGFDANLRRLSFQSLYTRIESPQDRHQALQGSVQGSRPLWHGLAALYLTDLYRVSEANSFTGQGISDRTENVFTAGGSFQRTFFRTLSMSLRANYANTGGDVTTRNDLSVGLRLNWSYGKTMVGLFSQVNWRSVGETTSRYDRIRMQVTRRF